jgi:RNA polymerase sigma-70 factor (ECF subfamily)
VSDPGRDRERRDRFEAIYESNYHRVLGYALRRTSRDEAADVVAETFLVAWRRLEDVPDGGEALLWLYGTARRVLANQERSHRRRERLSERARADLVREPEPATLGQGVNLAVVAFAKLRAEERELLALVAWEGLDAGEIAEVYGCSRNAARIRLHRARHRFARELARLGVSPKDNAAPGLVTPEPAGAGAPVKGRSRCD